MSQTCGIFCDDCLADGRMIDVIPDEKHGFHAVVCPRCERVYGPMISIAERHYASGKGYRDRLRRLKKEQRIRGTYQNAFVDRILRPID